MRRLLIAAAGFTAAAALANYVLSVPGRLLSALLCAGLMLMALLLKGSTRRRALIFCAFAALGFSWSALHYRLAIAPAETLAGQNARVRAVVTDYAAQDGDYASVPVKLSQEGYPKTRTLVDGYGVDLSRLRPGDVIDAPLRFFSAGIRRGEKTDTWYAQGIFLRAQLEASPKVVGRQDFSWIYFPKELAKGLKEAVWAAFPRDVSGFLVALMLGDTSEIRADGALYSALVMSGIYHIVSVSGMHVSFVTAFVLLFAKRKRRASLAAIPLLVLLALVTGCGPAVVRAVVMQTLLLLAPVFRRQEDAPTSLAAALLLLLVLNPCAVMGVSLQLSFAAMAGLIAVAAPLYRKLSAKGKRNLVSRLQNAVAGTLAATLGASVFTIPLSALYFGTVSLLGALTNLLTLWAVSVLFLAGFAICGVYALFPALAAVPGAAAAVLARYVIAVARLVAGLPYAVLYTQSPYVLGWLVFTYLTVGVSLYLRYKKKKIRLIVPISAVLLGLCVCLFLSARLPGDFRVTVLDVGQGQCVVFMTKDSVVITDCGGNDYPTAGDEAADYLQSLGRRRVDALVFTHLDADHMNGAVQLMTRMRVTKLYYYEGSGVNAEALKNIQEAAKAYGVQVQRVKTPRSLTVGSMKFRLLPIGTEMAVRARCAGFSALVMGDLDARAEEELVATGQIWRTDLLVAGHHGSKYSSSEALLEAVSPGLAVISVGYNTYGHPAGEALARLEETRAEIYRTDRDGNVTVTVWEEGKHGGTRVKIE